LKFRDEIGDIMVQTFVISILIHAFAVYICGAIAELSEGWKKPHIALLMGLVGVFLLLVPQMLMVTPAGPYTPARPTSAGFFLGNGLAALWYIIAFAKLYEFGCGGIIAALAVMQVTIHLAANTISKMLR
jgi:membrane-bound metal-dependent hydrolase YbcI (DUF457 family)